MSQMFEVLVIMMMFSSINIEALNLFIHYLAQ